MRHYSAALAACCLVLLAMGGIVVSNSADSAVNIGHASVRITLRKGTTNIAPTTLCQQIASTNITPPAHCADPSKPLTLETCRALAVSAAKLEGLTRTTGANTYQCLMTETFPVIFSSNALPPYSVAVKWIPPRTNTDGSALDRLDRYLVSYSREGEAQEYSASVAGESSQTTISVPSAGRWRFAVVAIANEIQSAPSDPASLVVP